MRRTRAKEKRKKHLSIGVTEGRISFLVLETATDTRETKEKKKHRKTKVGLRKCDGDAPSH